MNSKRFYVAFVAVAIILTILVAVWIDRASASPNEPDFSSPAMLTWGCRYGGPVVGWYAPEYPQHLRYDPLIFVWLVFHSVGARVSYHSKLAYQTRLSGGTHTFWTPERLENGIYIIDGGTLYNYHLSPPLILKLNPVNIGATYKHSCGSFFPGIWNRDPYPGP